MFTFLRKLKKKEVIPNDEILLGLINIKIKGPSYTRWGICTNLEKQLVTHSSFVAWKSFYQQTIINWPLYSGESAYPIPSYLGEYDEESIYNDENIPKWSGAYGKLRYQLLDYLIEQRKLYLNNESS